MNLLVTGLLSLLLALSAQRRVQKLENSLVCDTTLRRHAVRGERPHGDAQRSARQQQHLHLALNDDCAILFNKHVIGLENTVPGTLDDSHASLLLISARSVYISLEKKYSTGEQRA
jgi:hypothetical protein